MLKHLSTGENHRRDRLFLIACCRGLWHLLVQPGCREAVELAERYTDGEASWEELDAERDMLEMMLSRGGDAAEDTALGVLSEATWVWQGLGLVCKPTNCWCVPPQFWGGGHKRGEGLDIEHGGFLALMASLDGANSDAISAQAGLVRCVYGNPFRPPSRDDAWLSWQSGVVASLAQAAYDSRFLPSGQLDPARLAILADALEEAGCTNADILDHLRGRVPHVRGCWPLDLLTGRT